MNRPYLPAEWHKQSAIQLTWPHRETDWAYMLEEVEDCFLHIAKEILKRQKLLIITPEPNRVRKKIEDYAGRTERLIIASIPSNDTWARDHAFITMLQHEGTPLLLDFCFNGWGLKFAAHHDNQINQQLYKSHLLQGEYISHLRFVLEGGSIESDGQGTLLTTRQCLLSPNRNECSQDEIEHVLKETFCLQQVLWLKHGYLAGDDTDGHVDTLARLCPDETITYVQCTDPTDEHYDELTAMENELKDFRTLHGTPYHLLPLPLPRAIYDKTGERLPATYANFLILNEAVLYPTYQQPQYDQQAGRVLAQAFPNREIVGIDCLALIKQHGSLHCVTMQYPENVFI